MKCSGCDQTPCACKVIEITTVDEFFRLHGDKLPRGISDRAALNFLRNGPRDVDPEK